MKILYMLPAAKDVYPIEAEERRKNLILSYATPTVEIDFDYLPEASGFNPWGGQDQPDHLKEDRVARTHALGAQRALLAQEQGYDAFCPFGLVDVGVEEARRLGVTIPVVGQSEACALFCGLLGRRFALCSYVASSVDDVIRNRVISLGLGNLFAGATEIGIPNAEYPDRRDEVLERFVDCTKQAREMGAEMMGMVAMSICPTEFSAKELTAASGFPVLDAMTAQIQMAEWLHRSGVPADMLRYPRNV